MKKTITTLLLLSCITAFSFAQSIGMTSGTIDFIPYIGTVVSCLGNARFLPWKLQFLIPETTVPRLGTGV